MDNIADTLYNYICALDYEDFKRKCNLYLEEVLHEYQEGLSILKELFG